MKEIFKCHAMLFSAPISRNKEPMVTDTLKNMYRRGLDSAPVKMLGKDELLLCGMCN